ncbi:UNVERIFIED_CONTAM: hypothetical protein FKN15_033396 [Acipenser sinensis]
MPTQNVTTHLNRTAEPEGARCPRQNSGTRPDRAAESEGARHTDAERQGSSSQREMAEMYSTSHPDRWSQHGGHDTTAGGQGSIPPEAADSTETVPTTWRTHPGRACWHSRGMGPKPLLK